MRRYIYTYALLMSASIWYLTHLAESHKQESPRSFLYILTAFCGQQQPFYPKTWSSETIQKNEAKPKSLTSRNN